MATEQLAARFRAAVADAGAAGAAAELPRLGLDLEESRRQHERGDREQYLRAIETLKRDVAELERQLHGLRQDAAGQELQAVGAPVAEDDEQLQSVISFLLQTNSRTTSAATATDASADVAAIADQVQSLAMFSGIEFFEASNSLVAIEGIEPYRKYALTGTCHDIFFRLAFEAVERTLEVASLAILVSPESRCELGPFVARCQRDKALLVFFRGLVRYARLRKQRLRTFERIYAQFPTIVTFPHSLALSTCMHIERRSEDGSVPALQLVFLWEIRVNTDGRALAHLELLPRASKAVLAQDRHHVLANLPSRFQDLVELQGVSRALEAVIQSLMMERL